MTIHNFRPSKIAEDNNVIVTGSRSINGETDKEHAIKHTPDTVSINLKISSKNQPRVEIIWV